MKKKILLTAFAAFLAFFAYGCSDDDTTNPTDETPAFKFTQGSSWNFQRFELDTLSNRLSTYSLLNTNITGTITYLSKQASVFVSLSDDKNDTVNFAIEGKKLYSSKAAFSPQKMTKGLLPVDIPDQWYTFADYGNDSWTIYRDSLKNIPIPVDGNTYNFNGILTITGKRVESASVKWGPNEDKTVTATDFQHSYTFEGKIAGIVTLNKTFVIHNYYNKDMGFIKEKMESQLITVPIILKSIHVAGYETVLQSYNIATGE